MDLTTRYLGLPLKHPVVSSASPLAAKLDGVQRLAEAGAAAIVLPSLFEEQIEHEAMELHWATTQGTESFAEATSYFPEPESFLFGPDEYLNLIRKARAAVDVPIIGSLNGCTTGGWVRYARHFEEAGASAIELNIYYLVTDPFANSEAVEANYLDVLESVKSQVTIPVALKLAPYFSAFASMARRCDAGGADGLVLFNRFYQPDLDIENLEVLPDHELSTSANIRLPLRWIAILRGHLSCSLAATSGIHTAEDVIKLVMAGADVTMMCSALLRHGPAHIKTVVTDMRQWMEDHQYESVNQMKGTMSQQSVADPAAYERANYMKTLQSWRQVK